MNKRTIRLKQHPLHNSKTGEGNCHFSVNVLKKHSPIMGMYQSYASVFKESVLAGCIIKAPRFKKTSNKGAVNHCVKLENIIYWTR